MKKKVIVGFGIFVLGILVAIFSASRREKLNPLDVTAKIPAIRKEVVLLLANNGPKEAYEEIKRRYQNKDFYLQHAAAHIFGELVYDKEGKEGIIYCDNNFAFGCYHAVFSHAVRDEGLVVIKSLKEYCLGFSGRLERIGCQHGLGHGIGEFLGPEKIIQGLAFCEDEVSQKPFYCWGGVFMEYNFPFFFSKDEGEQYRPLKEDNIFEPCESLPSKYQNVCYYRLPEWWEIVLGRDYFQMGELCRSLNQENKRYCFMGIGTIIVDAKLYSQNQTISSCKKVGGDGFDFCMAGADFISFISQSHEKGSFCRANGVNEDVCNDSASELESLGGI